MPESLLPAASSKNSVILLPYGSQKRRKQLIGYTETTWIDEEGEGGTVSEYYTRTIALCLLIATTAYC